MYVILPTLVGLFGALEPKLCLGILYVHVCMPMPPIHFLRNGFNTKKLIWSDFLEANIDHTKSMLLQGFHL